MVILCEGLEDPDRESELCDVDWIIDKSLVY